jgi:hypothetical protein
VRAVQDGGGTDQSTGFTQGGPWSRPALVVRQKELWRVWSGASTTAAASTVPYWVRVCVSETTNSRLLIYRVASRSIYRSGACTMRVNEKAELQKYQKKWEWKGEAHHGYHEGVPENKATPAIASA